MLLLSVYKLDFKTGEHGAIRPPIVLELDPMILAYPDQAALRREASSIKEFLLQEASR